MIREPHVPPAHGVRSDSTDRDRVRATRNVLLFVLALNLAVATAKAIYGALSGSLAVASDAMHSAVDAAINVVALAVVKLAAAPPDEGHPYGHRKIEIVASTAIGVAVASVALHFAWAAATALFEQRPAPATTAAGFWVLGGTLVANVVIARYEARRARVLHSPLLAADAAHTASDVVVTGIVLTSFLASHLGVRWADAGGTFVVVLATGRIAWRIIAANLGLLVDRAMVDADRVRQIAERHPDVRQCHRVRSRGVEGMAQVDLHLLLDGQMTLHRAHEIAHQVEDALRASLPAIADVVIHTEPEETGPEGL